MTPRCASCLSWKRKRLDKRLDMGLCWHPANIPRGYAGVVFEDGHCEHFTDRLTPESRAAKESRAS